jgi:hypothetical protein
MTVDTMAIGTLGIGRAERAVWKSRWSVGSVANEGYIRRGSINDGTAASRVAPGGDAAAASRVAPGGDAAAAIQDTARTNAAAARYASATTGVDDDSSAASIEGVYTGLARVERSCINLRGTSILVLLLDRGKAARRTQ